MAFLPGKRRPGRNEVDQKIISYPGCKIVSITTESGS